VSIDWSQAHDHVLQADTFVPAFLDAVDTTIGRRASRLVKG
jgi:hypothetical protein